MTLKNKNTQEPDLGELVGQLELIDEGHSSMVKDEIQQKKLENDLNDDIYLDWEGEPCGNCKNECISLLNSQQLNASECMIVFSSIQYSQNYNEIFKQTQILVQAELYCSKLIIQLNPQFFKNLRYILDCGALYGKLKATKFTKFMKERGYWPDIQEKNQNKVAQDEIEFHYAKKKTKITINSIILLMQHNNTIIYSFNIKQIDLTIQCKTQSNVTTILIQDLKIYDCGPTVGNHPTILTNLYKTEDNANEVQVQIKTYSNENLIKINQYKTFCGVRIKNAKIVFIKRFTNEIQYYIRKILLSSLWSEISEIDEQWIQLKIDQLSQNASSWKQIISLTKDELEYRISTQSEKDKQIKQLPETPSLFKFTLVALNINAIAYRNTISSEGLFFSLAKVGFWFTGPWGEEFDDLIKTGQFTDELAHQEGGNFQVPEQANLNETFHTAKSENVLNQSKQKVVVFGIVGRNVEFFRDMDKDIFLQSDNKTLNEPDISLTIVFEDKEFNTKLYKQKSLPMKIFVELPKLKLFLYDSDFNVLCKFFQENLGEQPQVVTNPNYMWDIYNWNIWNFLEIKANSIVVKIFRGSRNDVSLDYSISGTQQQFKKQISGKKKSIYLTKNSASIAFLRINKMTYQFMMRENGAKLMKLIAKSLKVADFRYQSLFKRDMNQKWIVFKQKDHNQFKESDEQTTDQDVNQDNNRSQYDDVSSLDQDQLVLDKPNEKQDSFTPPLEQQQQQNVQKVNNCQILNNNNDSANHLLNYATINKQSKPKWVRFKNWISSIFSCKRKKPYQNKGSIILDEENQPKQYNQEQIQKEITQKTEDDQFTINDPDIRKRRWINFRYKQIVEPSMPEVKDECNKLLEEFNVQDFDIKFIMKTNPDGEKQIKVQLDNKNILLIVDLIWDIVLFFKNPFNGSDIQPYICQPPFNNYAPMYIEIVLNNICLILPGSLNKRDNQSLGIIINLLYQQQWKGDSWMGPGMVSKDIDLSILKVILFDFTHIGKDKKSGFSLDLEKKEKELKTPKTRKSNLKQQQDIEIGRQTNKERKEILNQISEAEEISDNQIENKSIRKAKFNIGNANQQFQSILQPIRIKINMNYQLDFFRKAVDPSFKQENIYCIDRQDLRKIYKDINQENFINFKSFNTLGLTLKPLTSSKSLIAVAINDITNLTTIFSLVSKPSYIKPDEEFYKMTRNDPPILNFVDTCISEKKIKIKELPIEILKNKDGVKLGLIKIANFKLYKKDQMQSGNMTIIGNLSIQYINKRKMEMEPFLEPWSFCFTKTTTQEEGNIEKNVTKIQNLMTKESEALSYYVKEHSNSLNINLSQSAVETILEAYYIFSKQIKDLEPYKIYNRTGSSLEFRDTKKEIGFQELKESQMQQWNGQKHFLIESTFSLSQNANKRLKELNNIAMINLVILKKEQSNQFQLGFGNEEQVVSQNNSFSKTNKNANLKEDQYNISCKELDIDSNKRPDNNLLDKSEIHEEEKTLNYNSEKETKAEQSQLQKIPNLSQMQSTRLNFGKKYTPTIIKSQYKMIKYIDLDFAGQSLYSLEKVDRDDGALKKKTKLKDNALKNISKTLKENFKKIKGGLNFLSNQKDIKEEGRSHLYIHTAINPACGKEITISSSVFIFNNIDDASIEIGFLANGQNTENVKQLIQPQELYPIPVDLLENQTYIRFTSWDASNEKKRISNQIDFQYYELDDLIGSKTDIDTYVEDTKFIVREALEKVSGYAGRQFQYLNDEKRKKYEKDVTQSSKTIKQQFQDNAVTYINFRDRQIQQSKISNRSIYNNFCFQLICTKTEIPSKNKPNKELRYLTHLILQPLFKFTNTLPVQIRLKYDISTKDNKKEEKSLNLWFDNKDVKPATTLNCVDMEYSIHNVISFEIDGQSSNNIKLFNNSNDIDKYTSSHEFGGEDHKLIIYADVVRTSTSTRAVTIFCPYLIINKTEKQFFYREKSITGNILSGSQQIKFKFEGSQNSDQQDQEIEQLKNIHMFSTSKDIKNIQIGLLSQQTRKKEWSQPFELINSNDNVLCVKVDQEIFSNTNQTNQNIMIDKSETITQRYLMQNQLNKNKFGNKDFLKKAYFEFGIRMITAPGIFFRSQLIIITPRIVFHNETQYPVAAAQIETEHFDDQILRIKPGEYKHFYFPDEKKKNTLLFLTMNSQQDILQDGLVISV